MTPPVLRAGAPLETGLPNMTRSQDVCLAVDVCLTDLPPDSSTFAGRAERPEVGR